MTKKPSHKQTMLSINSLKIRAIQESDISLIVSEFERFQWSKPASTFEGYCKEQSKQERLIWLAFYQEAFAGYVTLKWQSYYQPFNQSKIPEIMDLNVLPPYQKKGIGSALLDLAEKEAFKKSSIVGIGVGLYSDYGPAQKLYIARGYQPDGLGLTYNYKPVEAGSMVCLDDDLVLWFTKKSCSPKSETC